MAKKLLTAEDVLKLKGYNSSPINGSELLAIIAEYYLTNDISAKLYIAVRRFVEFKDVPKCGYVDLTSTQKMKDFCEQHPEMAGWGKLIDPAKFYEVLQYADPFEYEWQDSQISYNGKYIVIDEASETVIVRFLRGVGGYKLKKYKSNIQKGYILTIV